MTDGEDRIQREHERGEGEGLEEGSPEWWAERAKRHTLDGPARVIGHIDNIDPNWRERLPPVPRPLTPEEEEIERIIATMTGDEDDV